MFNQNLPIEQDLAGIAFLESPAPLVITSDRKILRCSNSFARLFGYEKEELEGELLMMLYPSSADYYAIGSKCLEALKNATSYEDERFMQHKNREIFWARARGVTLSPESPFKLMIWSMERIQHSDTRTIKLTPREQEISGYIVNGLTCKETALELNISHRTVEVHRARLMKKLGARNTADLVSKIVMINTAH